MQGTFICPFCGQPGNSSKEHVWPQWLRKFEAYEVLRESRRELPLPEAKFPHYYQDDEGRFRTGEQLRGNAPLLPDVTVRVCAECNNGWMSRLENEVSDILKPWLEGLPRALTPADAASLARWVMKTAGAYSLYVPPEFRALVPEQLSAIAQARPLESFCRIWMAFSDDPTAYVAAGYEPFWLGPPEAARPKARPSTAAFHVSAHGIVFLAHFWDGPEELQHVVALPQQLRPGVQQLAPRRGVIRGPLSPIPSHQLQALRTYLRDVIADIGFPVEGTTADEAQAAFERFMNSEDDDMFASHSQRRGPSGTGWLDV